MSYAGAPYQQGGYPGGPLGGPGGYSAPGAGPGGYPGSGGGFLSATNHDDGKDKLGKAGVSGVGKMFGGFLAGAKEGINNFSKQASNLYMFGGMFTMSLLVFIFLSSKDFSFLLTFAALWRCFGLLVLNYKVWTSKSAKGISVKTLELYGFVFVARLLSIMRHQGYLPFDKTGDWFYHFVEFASLAAVALLVFAIFLPLRSTYDERFDKFGNLHIPPHFGAAYLLVPCFILAIFVKPHLNRDISYFSSDMCWSLSMYLEAVAMFPQIYMFQKQAGEQNGQVDALIGHTVFSLGFSRIFELIFWLGSFKELADSTGSRLPGYVVLLSQFGHLAIMGDFFYYYFQSIRAGTLHAVPVPVPVPVSVRVVSYRVCVFMQVSHCSHILSPPAQLHSSPLLQARPWSCPPCTRRTWPNRYGESARGDGEGA